MEFLRAIHALMNRGSFLLLLPNCKVELSTLSITRAVTPYCVANRSPILTQHANSLRVICRRIASTACVPSQAPFSQVSSEWKLEKTGLQGAYPPGPLFAAKISNYPTGISDFFTLIKTHRRKRHIKNFLFKKEREGLSNGKKRKTK